MTKSSVVKRDSDYKAKGFEFCDSAQVLLQKRKEKLLK